MQVMAVQMGTASCCPQSPKHNPTLKPNARSTSKPRAHAQQESRTNKLDQALPTPKGTQRGWCGHSPSLDDVTTCCSVMSLPSICSHSFLTSNPLHSCVFMCAWSPLSAISTHFHFQPSPFVFSWVLLLPSRLQALGCIFPEAHQVPLYLPLLCPVQFPKFQ